MWKTDILPLRCVHKLRLGLQGKIFLASLGKPRCSLRPPLRSRISVFSFFFELRDFFQRGSGCEVPVDIFIYLLFRCIIMTMKRPLSIILNGLIFVLVTFATTCMILGLNLFSRTEAVRAFTATNWVAFKYFTVDSNVLAGITALIYFIIEIKGKELSERAAAFLHCLRLASATGVALTMLVTAFFLIPQFGKDWYILYIDNNFFFHLTIPLLCIITYIFFEPGAAALTLKQSVTGIIPMLLYGIAYTINIIAHLGNGHPLKDYDWYGFLGDKLTNAIIAIPAMLLITWSISLSLWILNRKINSKKSSQIQSTKEKSE